MRVNYFIGEFDLSGKKVLINDREIIHQIKNVLRLREGDRLKLGDALLNYATAKILEFGQSTIEAEILSVAKNLNEPENKTILFCSLLKHDHFELAVQKSVEIGIGEIVPVISRHSIKQGVNEKRLRKIIKEAAEQSGRGIIPFLHPVMNFNEALDFSKKNDVNLFFNQSGESISGQYFSEFFKVGIFIGPEGGWEKEEIQAAANLDFKILSLGKLTLRAETAAIIAGYLICNRKDL